MNVFDPAHAETGDHSCSSLMHFIFFSDAFVKLLFNFEPLECFIKYFTHFFSFSPGCAAFVCFISLN